MKRNNAPHPIWKDLAQHYKKLIEENKFWWTNYERDCERQAKRQCCSISGNS